MEVTLLVTEGCEMRSFDDIEYDVLRLAIDHYKVRVSRGHLTEVARRLKIGRSTLYRRLDHFAAQGRPLVKKRAPNYVPSQHVTSPL